MVRTRVLVFRGLFFLPPGVGDAFCPVLFIKNLFRDLARFFRLLNFGEPPAVLAERVGGGATTGLVHGLDHQDRVVQVRGQGNVFHAAPGAGGSIREYEGI